MKYYLALAICVVVTSTYGRVLDRGNLPLKDGKSFLSLTIYSNGKIKGVLNRLKVEGKVLGKVHFLSDGGFTCQIKLFSKDIRGTIRGRFSLTQIQHPFTDPSYPLPLYYPETRREFLGNVQNSDFLKPPRKRFHFVSSEFVYPDLY